MSYFHFLKDIFVILKRVLESCDAKAAIKNESSQRHTISLTRTLKIVRWPVPISPVASLSGWLLDNVE